jgi:hypothetical protein
MCSPGRLPSLRALTEWPEPQFSEVKPSERVQSTNLRAAQMALFGRHLPKSRHMVRRSGDELSNSMGYALVICESAGKVRHSIIKSKHAEPLSGLNSGAKSWKIWLQAVAHRDVLFMDKHSLHVAGLRTHCLLECLTPLLGNSHLFSKMPFNSLIARCGAQWPPCVRCGRPPVLCRRPWPRFTGARSEADPSCSQRMPRRIG